MNQVHLTLRAQFSSLFYILGVSFEVLKGNLFVELYRAVPLMILIDLADNIVSLKGDELHTYLKSFSGLVSPPSV